MLVYVGLLQLYFGAERTPQADFFTHVKFYSVRRLSRYFAIREEQGTTRTRAHPGGELHSRHARYGLY